MFIHRLAPEIAQKIAAGEVVERPLSVVKELMENSIDAGAETITVEIVQGGKVLISVADDGSGIMPDELPLAVEKHATSKISNDADLEAIATLGYRREALASIAAVSRMELFSRRKEMENGAILTFTGNSTSVSEIPLQPGTRVTVRDLFYNLPARRKFMKSAPAEFRRIAQLVEDYALAYPGIAFQLINDGKNVFSSPGSGSVEKLLGKLWGNDPEIRTFQSEKGDSSVHIWWQDCGTASRFQLVTFVNGRRVSDNVVRAALINHPWARRGNWLVMLRLPPGDVDVNVHPAKSEIMLRKSQDVFELVYGCVDQFSRGFSPLTPAELDKARSPTEKQGDDEPFVPLGSRAGRKAILEASGKESHREGETVPQGGLFSRVIEPEFRVAQPELRGLSLGLTMPAAEDKKSPPVSKNGSEAVPKATRNLITTEDTIIGVDGKARYLGQMEQGYLLFLDDRGLLIVDPHSAHERVNYERIMAACSSPAGSEKLLVPITLPPTLCEEAQANAEKLEAMGILLNENGALASLPCHANGLGISPVDLLRGALGAIEDQGDNRPLAARWAMKSCKCSVKLTTRLQPAEAQQLLNDLLHCQQPNACPHGRPTVLRLDGKALDAHFGR